MTPKQTALRKVATLIMTALATGIMLGLALTMFSLTQISITLALVALAYMIKLIYDIELEKAVIVDRLNQK